MSTSEVVAPRRCYPRDALAGLLIAGCVGSPGRPEPQPHPVVIALSTILPTNLPADASWRVVIDTLSVQRVASLTSVDLGTLQAAVGRPVELGVRCPQDDEARCTTIELWEATRTGEGAILVVQWARAARLCGGSFRARYLVEVVSGRGRIIEVSEHIYGDCGPPPPG